jgi:diadenosine tetraphosphate (Ap4A) HIT family hydrolase
MSYVHVDKELSKNPENCVFCKHLKKGEVVREYTHFFVVVNDFPYMEHHLMLLPKRHLHSELEFTEEEQQDFILANRQIISAYQKTFNSCFTMTRENTPRQTQWHWHRHFVPHEMTIIPEAPRVPFQPIDKTLLELL